MKYLRRNPASFHSSACHEIIFGPRRRTNFLLFSSGAVVHENAANGTPPPPGPPEDRSGRRPSSGGGARGAKSSPAGEGGPANVPAAEVPGIPESAPGSRRPGPAAWSSRDGATVAPRAAPGETSHKKPSPTALPAFLFIHHVYLCYYPFRRLASIGDLKRLQGTLCLFPFFPCPPKFIPSDHEGRGPPCSMSPALRIRPPEQRQPLRRVTARRHPTPHW